jgi:serine/threonine protein kinase
MQLPPGTRLGIYEVIGPLGAGGMGEVYCARDTRLDRDVALKLLPEAFARDPERLSRFEREAKVLASLNHPNIAAIYGLDECGGVRFLVLEFVPGEDLKGPLPLEDALKTCRQVAEALELAHEKGVVHRDLKPANIKITPEGKVKVLDFGLAKALTEEASASSLDLSNSPTMADAATRTGVILGTASYMSPEQARGRPVDRRTDTWAFGCVLFEVLAGRKVFAGDSASDSMAAILRQEPDWRGLPPETPAAIRNLLRRCLQKDRDRRLQSIGDARIEIDEALSAASAEPAAAASPASAQRALPQPAWLPNRAWWPGLVVMAVVVTALLTWLLKPVPQPTAKQVMRFPITLPAGTDFLQGAISTDGLHLVYSTRHNR